MMPSIIISIFAIIVYLFVKRLIDCVSIERHRHHLHPTPPREILIATNCRLQMDHSKCITNTFVRGRSCDLWLRCTLYLNQLLIVNKKLLLNWLLNSGNK